MKTGKTRGPLRRQVVRRISVLLLLAVVMTGMITVPAHAASAERVSMEVGQTQYLKDQSSPTLAGATIVKNNWVWQSSNPYVADIITNNAPSCQVRARLAGTAIISCTVYTTTSRTNPITHRTEMIYGSVMGSSYQVTVTDSGTNINTGNGTNTGANSGGGNPTYLNAAPDLLTFDLADYSEQRVSLTVRSGAPTNHLELGNSQYVWIRQLQSSASIYKYTLTVGLMPDTSTGYYTAEVLLKSLAGKVYDRITIPVTVVCSHAYGDWSLVQEESCAQAGKQSRVCRYCGKTQSETIPPAGHSFGTDWLSDSSRHWKECATCHEKSDTADHIWDQGTVTSPAGYGQEGVKTFACTVCGATKSESIPQLSGSNQSQTSGKRVPSASFTQPSLSGVAGKSERNFLRTNSTGRITYSSSDSSVATVNSLGRVSFLKAGTAVITASVAETSRYQAASASYVVTVTDSATAAQPNCRGIHKYGQSVIRKEPTCCTSGKSIDTCLLCGYQKTRWISPTFRHMYDDGVITQPLSGRYGGRITFTCVTCGKTKTRSFFSWQSVLDPNKVIYWK